LAQASTALQSNANRTTNNFFPAMKSKGMKDMKEIKVMNGIIGMNENTERGKTANGLKRSESTSLISQKSQKNLTFKNTELAGQLPGLLKTIRSIY